jgi:hypothetical protein
MAILAEGMTDGTTWYAKIVVSRLMLDGCLKTLSSSPSESRALSVGANTCANNEIQPDKFQEQFNTN